VSLRTLAKPQPANAVRPFLPYGRQVIEQDDIDSVCETLRGDFLTTGPAVGRFESALAKSVNVNHAIVCANGTAALYMAARALGLGPGTKIIVPSVTFLATASAAHLSGAEIVFADVDPDSGLMRPKDLKEALDRAGNADAVFNVHLNGQCGALEEIAAIARGHGARIVDDACHALGTRYTDGSGVQSQIGANALCDLSVFSFHPVKAIAMGEGGAVTTNDAATAAILMRTRNHGMTRDTKDFTNLQDAFDSQGHSNPWYYELIEPGFNWRANDIQCALGVSQLAKLDRFLVQRRALATAYDELLAPYGPHLRPVTRQRSCLPALHLYVVQIDFEFFDTTRAHVMQALANEGIGSQVHYFPVHRQPYYARRYGVANLPGADRYYARALSLPFFASMTQDDVERVVGTLVAILNL
jgi:UDP-4-amino-4,6-dideoxy-N-acetyl-beta-L-altrosamine transaminase